MIQAHKIYQDTAEAPCTEYTAPGCENGFRSGLSHAIFDHRKICAAVQHDDALDEFEAFYEHKNPHTKTVPPHNQLGYHDLVGDDDEDENTPPTKAQVRLISQQH